MRPTGPLPIAAAATAAAGLFRAALMPFCAALLSSDSLVGLSSTGPLGSPVVATPAAAVVTVAVGAACTSGAAAAAPVAAALRRSQVVPSVPTAPVMLFL